VVLFGKRVPVDKPLSYSLLNIYGLGYSQSLELCKILGVSKDIYFENLSEKKRTKLKDLLQNMIVGSLRLHEKLNSIKILKESKTYRGFRHTKKLPVRGQRTRTNARTRKKGIV